jgi:peptidoglycan hydrolase-like protein with peptidoglycan-binding domain
VPVAPPPAVRVALAPDRTLGEAAIPTGRTTDIVIQRPRLPATMRPFGTYLPRSVLLLPRPGEPHPWAPVIALLRFLEPRLDHGALLVGHRAPDEPTDFARLRAEALQCFLADDEPGWVDIAAAHGRVQDTQVFLEHLHREHGWSTHVPEITDRADSATARTVEEFQRTYNLAFHRQVLEDGVIGRQTLGAVFEVAKTELVHWLERSEVALHSLRFFADDRPTLAADAGFDGDRWVELVALPLGAPYDLGREPAGAGIYRVARRTPLPSEEIEPPVYGVLQVRLVDEWGQPLAHHGYTLRVGTDARVGETDAHGMLAEAMLPAGVPVLRLADGRPVLFHDRYEPRRELPIEAETGDFSYLEGVEDEDHGERNTGNGEEPDENQDDTLE